jgi:hypothetical protein
MTGNHGKGRRSRREFLRAAGRILIAGAIGYIGARLLKRASFTTGEACINNSICRGCSVYSGCGLPQALSAKRARGEA